LVAMFIRSLVSISIKYCTISLALGLSSGFCLMHLKEGGRGVIQVDLRGEETAGNRDST